jgi:hypothetical protein
MGDDATVCRRRPLGSHREYGAPRRRVRDVDLRTLKWRTPVTTDRVIEVLGSIDHAMPEHLATGIERIRREFDFVEGWCELAGYPHCRTSQAASQS